VYSRYTFSELYPVLPLTGEGDEAAGWHWASMRAVPCL